MYDPFRDDIIKALRYLKGIGFERNEEGFTKD